MTDNRTTERVDHSPRVREAIDELMREKDATDNRTTELREKLTERGVEYTTRDGMKATSITHITHWCADGVDAEFTEQIKGCTRLTASGCTPEQAIAATLGSVEYG